MIVPVQLEFRCGSRIGATSNYIVRMCDRRRVIIGRRGIVVSPPLKLIFSSALRERWLRDRCENEVLRPVLVMVGLNFRKRDP